MHTLEMLPGIGGHTLSLLNKLGVSSVEDLLTFYPFRYDVIKRSNLFEVEEGGKVIVDGIISSLPSVYYINKKLNKMSFQLQTDKMLTNVVIFNRAYLKSKIEIGSSITVFGKFDRKHHSITATDIRFSKLSNEVKVEPVYHAVYGITSKKIENLLDHALACNIVLEDYIPSMFREKYHFVKKEAAVMELHRPTSAEHLKVARLRTKYEELFIFMLRMQYLKNNTKTKIGLKREMNFEKIEKFIDTLPFTLTEDQMTSVKEIYHDLESSKRMNRLLQGDVGSGKTIVSILAMYMNCLSGYQSALMAPTEILASQHYQNITKLFEKEKIQVALLTGKTKAKEKKEIYRGLEEGTIDLVIGTHALISEKVVYKNLGLVITDEQHRFGVRQRSNLQNKGILPDILYMSATPIPRTYALTLYGDMDISNIHTRPKGRKEIITIVRKEKEMKDVLERMYEELLKGHQIYVIAPLIEESEKMDLENVEKLSEKMHKAFGKKYKIGVLHGKLKNEQKEEIMTSFSKGETQILISTTVVEVGVDVANATMMVIFDAYRFGLSTLHQLRGRVGRSALQSYCILISNGDVERLRIMERESDGFKISEEDFRLRGSGDLFGTKQSGDMRFMLADLKKDFSILLKAKEDCLLFLKEGKDKELLRKILEPVQNIES